MRLRRPKPDGKSVLAKVMIERLPNSVLDMAVETDIVSVLLDVAQISAVEPVVGDLGLDPSSPMVCLNMLNK